MERSRGVRKLAEKGKEGRKRSITKAITICRTVLSTDEKVTMQSKSYSGNGLDLERQDEHRRDETESTNVLGRGIAI
jgi:hypothetical protein